MELAINIITLVASIAALLTSVLPPLFNRKRYTTEFEHQYALLKKDIASALTLYAYCYYNPVDLAREPEHKLPQCYEEASAELRKLGATASGLASIIPEKQRRLAARRKELTEVFGCLIGLSNSVTTPYNCGVSIEHMKAVQEWENKIKELLSINDP